MKKIYLLILASVAVLLLIFSQKLNTQTYIVVNGIKFEAEVANTDKSREIGLSKYTNIKDTFAMVFPFEKSDKHGFWMKNMKFPIDIIYTNNGKIIQVYKNIPNPTVDSLELTVYRPIENSDMVVEVKSGISAKYNFKKGDEVRLVQ